MTSQVAEQLVKEFLNTKVKSVRPIIGKGSVNQIFVVQSDSSDLVVRMNSQKDYLHVYEKEKWCIEQAGRIGIPGPDVLSIGETEGVAYMIQTFQPGENGEDCLLNRGSLWRTLGEYAGKINMIQVEGYGEILDDPSRGLFRAPLHENFNGTWNGYITYNIESLTEEDELIRLGIIDRAQSRALKRRFESLLEIDFQLGLNHGDLSLKNTIVEPGGRVHLIDWGSAEVSVSPCWDLIQLIHCRLESNNPTEAEILHFLEGYGISQGEFKDMQDELYSLMLLRAVDKCRWAVDCKPPEIGRMADNVSRIVAGFA